jgi:hypothetical protein
MRFNGERDVNFFGRLRIWLGVCVCVCVCLKEREN